MPPVLLFTLEAPLAAMGDLAVGERRYGSDRPTKSAVLGLVAAALGIDRSADASHAALAAGYGYAVRSASGSSTLSDYHTVQAPPARKGRHWATRRDELAEPQSLGTTVSQREYRAGMRSVVALWEREGGERSASLLDLEQALRTPAFTIYFGRKACPLGRPPFPMVVEAETLVDAFQAYESADAERRPRWSTRDPEPFGPIHADVDASDWLGANIRKDRITSRRDAIVSRRRWQFGLRQELVAVPNGGDSSDRGDDG